MKRQRNYDVGLRNGIFDPKHYRAMRGDALWLFSYLVDRQTRRFDKHGLGKVAGGMPICDEDIAGTLGCSDRTVSRWRTKLLRGGYIAARRTSYGYAYAIAKPKKWKSDPTELSDHSDPMIGQICPITGSPDPTDPPADPTELSETKKRDKRDSSSSTATTAAISEEEMARKISAVWSYYLEATNSEETISLPAKKKVLACLRLLKPGTEVYGAKFAIDAAVHAAKRSGKEYMRRWPAIFGKTETFKSLIEDCRQYDIPAAAELADEWLPESIKQERIRREEEKKQQEIEEQQKYERHQRWNKYLAEAIARGDVREGSFSDECRLSDEFSEAERRREA